jgi:hypothetical protein
MSTPTKSERCPGSGQPYDLDAVYTDFETWVKRAMCTHGCCWAEWAFDPEGIYPEHDILPIPPDYYHYYPNKAGAR